MKTEEKIITVILTSTSHDKIHFDEYLCDGWYIVILFQTTCASVPHTDRALSFLTAWLRKKL